MKRHPKRKRATGKSAPRKPGIVHRYLLLVAVLCSAMTVVYCSSKERSMEPMMNIASERKPKPPEEPVDDMPSLDFKAAFFDVDKAVLRPDGKKALKPTAEWLKKNPGVTIQIEGYCDERGSDAYNLVLGEKRAKAAKAYLVSQGISPERISIVSYGKVEGSGEKVMAANRRAGLIVIYPTNPK